jgi:DMSO/TMAO reductase YedYZ heme-binding membrane subunit
VSIIDLSGDAGLVALGLLTLNILLGLLISVKYNPVRAWPHRKINTVKIHNWTGYVALATAILHAVLLLAVSKPAFSVVDVVFPVRSPSQPLENTIGAVALYAVAFVVVTSYYRFELGRKTWKRLHYTAYGAAVLFYVHSLLTDPGLRDAPIDYLDGEKVFVELCLVVAVAAVVTRIVYAKKHPKGKKAARMRAAMRELVET